MFLALFFQLLCDFENFRNKKVRRKEQQQLCSICSLFGLQFPWLCLALLGYCPDSRFLSPSVQHAQFSVSLSRRNFFFLAAFGLRCCARDFYSCGKRELLFVAVRKLLIAVASLAADHGL